jgi:hypothetical protein
MNVYETCKSYCCILIIILITISQFLSSTNPTTVQIAIGQQFPIGMNNSNNTSSQSNTIDNISNFLTYNNQHLGIQIQYPSNWSAIEYPYNPIANNTIVGFFAKTKTSSELGNISGVSGSFVPYLDIYVFDSKNMSFDKIVDGTVNKFRNNENFVISESKPYAVKGNHPAHILVYDAIVGGDEFFRKMQVYYMFGSKIYVLSFTSQQALFSNYIPIVQKMASSFVAMNTGK